MAGTIAFLLKAEAVISLYENSKNSLKILQFSRKTPASPCQCWDIMAQIGVDALHREGVIFL